MACIHTNDGIPSTKNKTPVALHLSMLRRGNFLAGCIHSADIEKVASFDQQSRLHEAS